MFIKNIENVNVLKFIVLILSPNQKGEQQAVFQEPVLTMHPVITVLCVCAARGRCVCSGG